MNYALIGCGRIATNHIKAAIDNNFNIIAMCDIVEKNITELKKKYELKDYIDEYDDYKTMLKEHSELDLVAIATPSGLHADIALYCIKHKINIIIEKPIAMSIEDANKIIQEASKKGVVVCSCHQNRFNNAVYEVKNALEMGRLGKISHASVNIRWNRNKEYYDQAKWRGKWLYDGGCLMNQCIHAIDMIRWLLNDDVESVYGQTRRQFHDYIETEDVGVAIITFKSGIVATIEGSVNVYPHNLEETLFIFGDKGTVKLGGKSMNNIELWKFEDEQQGDENIINMCEKTANVYGNGHIKLYADVKKSIETQGVPYIDATDGKKALEIVLAIYKSMKNGEKVTLPLDDFSINEMEGIFERKKKYES